MMTDGRQDQLWEAKRQAEAASFAKTAFIASMSHEIRTPLNAILGLAQALEEGAPDGSEQFDFARRIQAAGRLVLRNLNDVLDLSKIEAGELQVERIPLRLSQVLQNLGHMAAGLAHGSGRGLRFEADTSRFDDLQGDPMRLQQVLLNLVSNALKFSASGDILLSCRVVARDCEAVRVRFEVRDHGPGIPADKLARLFRPYAQADASIARRFGGTGLGLSISRRLAEMMGGTIGADSLEGSGSTFWVELPFGLASSRPPDAVPDGAVTSHAGNGSPLAGLRVLIVDDSAMNLYIEEKMLARDGAIVTLASNGRQALELLDAQPDGFDVVLMDIQMPVLDGLTAIREIRKNGKLTGVPVIAVTAGVLPEERVRASEAGAAGFLAKPLDFRQIRSSLASYRPPAPAAP